ncbi:hypothetical protein J6590_080010 [Homalodisca vitripennis]|nr:hypothetical protein J6590_080010 [Homalodisca vitripennis]
MLQGGEVSAVRTTDCELFNPRHFVTDNRCYSLLLSDFLHFSPFHCGRRSYLFYHLEADWTINCEYLKLFETRGSLICNVKSRPIGTQDPPGSHAYTEPMPTLYPSLHGILDYTAQTPPKRSLYRTQGYTEPRPTLNSCIHGTQSPLEPKPTQNPFLHGTQYYTEPRLTQNLGLYNTPSYTESQP